MEFLKSLLLSVAISLWFLWLWKRIDLYRFALKFPGDLGLPFLGNLVRIRTWNNLMPIFDQMFKDSKHYTICMWMGTQPVILTADPEFIEQVLSSPALLNKAATLYAALHDMLEGGLLTLPDKEWQAQRKLINPAFTHKVLLSFLPIFNKAKNYAIVKLAALVDDDEHKLAKVFLHLSLGISVETTMGKPIKMGEEMDVDLAPKISYMMESIITYTGLNYIHLKWLYLLNRKIHKTKEYLKDFLVSLVMQKIYSNGAITNQHSYSSNGKEEDVLKMKKTPKIFIEQALKTYESKELTWTDVLSESATMLITSFETSANAIFTILVLLAMHPTVQERLFEEIVNMFPDKDFEMTYEQLKELPYLEMVINEALRLAPSAPHIGRQVVQDTQLNKDLLLPKGLEIFVSIYDLHRRKDIWGPDADKFNPDNFLPENLQGKHAFAYIPFAKGLRNCIGWRYAMFSIKIMIAGLVRNFRFTTSFKFEDIEFINNIALKYKEEPGLKIHLRN